MTQTMANQTIDAAGSRARRRDPAAEATCGSIQVPHIRREIRAHIGRDRAELEAAYRLLAARYRESGYEAPGSRPCRFTEHHALPGTATFVARHDGRVVATLSIVPDNDLLGLPMEGVYGPEVDRLRRHGRRLAEFTGLAVQGLSLGEFTHAFHTLIRLAMQYHLRRGGDTWIMAVHPRHRNYYRKVLGAGPLGPRRAYPSANGHPAEACVFDLESMKAHAPEMHRAVVGEALPEAALRGDGWSAERVRYFGSRSGAIDQATLEAILGAVERRGIPA